MTPEEFRFNFAPVGSDHYPFLREFDAMIEATRQEERERCEKAVLQGVLHIAPGRTVGELLTDTVAQCAAAIRALGDE